MKLVYCYIAFQLFAIHNTNKDLRNQRTLPGYGVTSNAVHAKPDFLRLLNPQLYISGNTGAAANSDE